MKTDSKSLFGNISLDLQAASLEFIGTTLWLMLALGGAQAASWSNQAALAHTENGHLTQGASIMQLMYSSVSFGLSLLVSVWLFFRVTGGLFNPAVSTGLLMIGAIGPVRWAFCCIAQLAGGIVASALLSALVPGPLVVTPALGPGVTAAQAVFIEAILTSALVLAVLMLGAEKQATTALAPIGIGLTLFAGQLWGSIYTGAAMNTARAFGPAVITGFDKNHWIYWVGPFTGSVIAILLYYFLKHIKYWDLSPDQDSTDPEKSPEDPFELAPTNHTHATRANGSTA